MHAQTEHGSYQQTDEELCEHSRIFTRFDANAKFSANTMLAFSFSAQRRVDVRHSCCHQQCCHLVNAVAHETSPAEIRCYHITGLQFCCWYFFLAYRLELEAHFCPLLVVLLLVGCMHTWRVNDQHRYVQKHKMMQISIK